MQWLLMSLLGLALIGLVLALLRLADREREYRTVEKADHAKCMAHVASVTSNQFLATHLRNLAVKWDSTENMLVLERLRRNYIEDGPSVVAAWLNEEADRL